MEGHETINVSKKKKDDKSFLVHAVSDSSTAMVFLPSWRVYVTDYIVLLLLPFHDIKEWKFSRYDKTRTLGEEIRSVWRKSNEKSRKQRGLTQGILARI